MNTLIDKLALLDKNEFTEFILKLYAELPTLRPRIELFANKPYANEQIKLLNNRIQSVNRGTRFFDYRHTHLFCSDLEDIADSIRELVTQNSEHQAVFELVDSFMHSHENAFERADDSTGSIGDIYRQTVNVWLTAAKQLKAKQQTTKTKAFHIHWVDEVLKRFNQNNYGMWDELLEKSAVLLTQAELEQLACRFENEARIALQNPPAGQQHNAYTANSRIALNGLGIALNNPDLIEKSTLLGNPKPNELQKIYLAKTLLNLGHAKRALAWLQSDFEKHFEYEQQHLIDTCYQLLGDKKSQIALRRTRYEQSPNQRNLAALLDIADAQERATLEAKAAEKAQAIDDFNSRVDALIALKATVVAAEQVINNANQLPSIGYYALPDWAKYFAQHGQPLAATLCYRELIDDILNSARSKAYHHAATYLEKLLALAPQITDYQTSTHHSAYVDQLKIQHKRKSAFWAKANIKL